MFSFYSVQEINVKLRTKTGKVGEAFIIKILNTVLRYTEVEIDWKDVTASVSYKNLHRLIGVNGITVYRSFFQQYDHHYTLSKVDKEKIVTIMRNVM